MLLRYSHTENNNIASIKHESEMELIRPLLHLPFSGHKEYFIKNLLASYPDLSEFDKIKTIRKIINAFLEEKSLSAMIEASEELERFLRAIGKRDHYIHQFETFLLGWNVILAIGHKKSLDELLGPIKIEELLRIWLITSIAHDLVGYSIQEANIIVKDLQRIYGLLGVQKIAKLFSGIHRKLYRMIKKKKNNSIISNLLRIFRIRKAHTINLLVGVDTGKIEEIIKEGIMQTLNINKDEAQIVQKKLKDSLDHSYISSILLGHKLDNTTFCGDDETRKRYLRWMLSAIALHHLDKIDLKFVEKIEFTKNPLAYALYIAAGLQEWARSIEVETIYPPFVLYRFNNDESEISLGFILNHDNWTEKLVEEELKYIKTKEYQLNLPKGPDVGLKIISTYISNSTKIDGKTITIIL